MSNADNVTPLGPKIKGKRFPANATAEDVRMLAAIYRAGGNAHGAIAAFHDAILAFMEAHPEHETPEALFVAFGIAPDEWNDLLSIGRADGEDEPE